jgi:hypothetical protein
MYIRNFDFLNILNKIKNYFLNNDKIYFICIIDV